MKIKHQNILLTLALSVTLLSCQQPQELEQKATDAVTSSANTATSKSATIEAKINTQPAAKTPTTAVSKPVAAEPKPVIKEEPVPKPTKVAHPSKAANPEKPTAKKPAAKIGKPVQRSVGPKISFKQAVYDFGEITEGDIIKHQFTFTNTGDKELEILSASASCGCTDPSYPFLGIPPGEEGVIGVTYNSVSKDGPQQAEVIIKTNATTQAYKLFLTGTVTSKPDSSKVDSSELTRVPKYPLKKS